MTTTSSGHILYHGSYVDLVAAGESPAGDVALVAGVHTADFPYFGTAPWDQCLLLVGAVGYTYTGRDPGAHLRIEFDLDAETATGVIRFAGEMRRATDGAMVAIELDLPIAVRKFPVRHLGEAYNILEIDGLIGMRWNPWELRGERGQVRVGGEDVVVTGLRGSAERGVLTNLRAHSFAIRYDYLATARPGENGYGLIKFESHALHAGSVPGKVLDAYLESTASATVTLRDGTSDDGNPWGVVFPGESDPMLFEDVVDLGPALLHRQMVKTTDADGAGLYGLREIFIEQPNCQRTPPPPRT